MEAVDHSKLLYLLKANSKDTVLRLCNEAFALRNNVELPGTTRENIANLLGISKQESSELLTALKKLIKNAIFQGSTEPGVVVKLFPDDFQKNLRDLLGRIIIENLPNWKTQALNNSVSLPRLVDYDWRIDMKTSSNEISRMSVPTCILQLQVQESAKKVGEVPEVNSVNVELTRETLNTVLDGLGKIRDQLSSVAGQ